MAPTVPRRLAGGRTSCSPARSLRSEELRPGVQLLIPPQCSNDLAAREVHDLCSTVAQVDVAVARVRRRVDPAILARVELPAKTAVAPEAEDSGRGGTLAERIPAATLRNEEAERSGHEIARSRAEHTRLPEVRVDEPCSYSIDSRVPL